MEICKQRHYLFPNFPLRVSQIEASDQQFTCGRELDLACGNSESEPELHPGRGSILIELVFLEACRVVTGAFEEVYQDFIHIQLDVEICQRCEMNELVERHDFFFTGISEITKAVILEQL